MQFDWRKNEKLKSSWKEMAYCIVVLCWNCIKSLNGKILLWQLQYSAGRFAKVYKYKIESDEIIPMQSINKSMG